MDPANTPRRQPNNDPHTNMPINTTNTNTNTSTNTRSSTPSSTLGITNPAAAPIVNRRPRMKSSDESIAAKQLQDRAFTALMNHQLLLRYAVANDVSIPEVRHYFEKVASGFEPDPIIKNWNVYDD